MYPKLFSLLVVFIALQAYFLSASVINMSIGWNRQYPNKIRSFGVVAADIPMWPEKGPLPVPGLPNAGGWPASSVGLMSNTWTPCSRPWMSVAYAFNQTNENWTSCHYMPNWPIDSDDPCKHVYLEVFCSTAWFAKKTIPLAIFTNFRLVNDPSSCNINVSDLNSNYFCSFSTGWDPPTNQSGGWTWKAKASGKGKLTMTWFTPSLGMIDFDIVFEPEDATTTNYLCVDGVYMATGLDPRASIGKMFNSTTWVSQAIEYHKVVYGKGPDGNKGPAFGSLMHYWEKAYCDNGIVLSSSIKNETRLFSVTVPKMGSQYYLHGKLQITDPE